MRKFDFAGYVTKNDIQCSDGVTIRHAAFISNDGTTVPLVWQHDYSSPSNTLGHIVLHHMDDGVWGEAYLNQTAKARDAMELIRHGDVNSFSIGARGIQKNGQDVIHGEIYEVSLVLKGANPGARIEHVLTHSAYGDHYDDEQGVIYTGLETNFLLHSDEEEEEDTYMKTVGEVLKTLTPEQEAAVELALTEGVDALNEDGLNLLESLNSDQLAAIGMVAEAMGEIDEDEDKHGEVVENEDEDAEYVENEDEDADEEDDTIEQSHGFEGEDILKHNTFYGASFDDTLTHSDVNTIIQAAVDGKAQSLAATLHANGMTSIDLKHGLAGIDILFPQTQTQKGIQVYNPGALNVEKIMGMFHKTPTSRVKNIFADISEETARARGYIKGNEKLDSISSLFFRETTPGTVLRRTKIDRDDIIDIRDNGIDVIQFLQKVQYSKLQEEIVRAAFIGDGRPVMRNGVRNPDKISEDHIRPITKDKDLFVIRAQAQYWADAVDKVIKTFPAYQGSGRPSLFINPYDLATLQTLKDKNGRYLYGASMDRNAVPSPDSIAAYFRCSEVVEYRDLPIGTIIIGNLVDYSFGMSKNGQIATFEQFDMDLNQEKYLIECRLSAAIQTPKSFIVLTIEKPDVVDTTALKFSRDGLKQHPSFTTNTDSTEKPGAKYASKHGVDTEEVPVTKPTTP